MKTKFKQTDIGLIPEDWKICYLGGLGNLKNGINYNRNDVGAGLKVVSVKQLFRGEFVSFDDLESVRKEKIKNFKDYLLQNGDLLFARGSLKREGAGKLAMVCNIPEKDIVFSGFIIRFRIKTKNDYLFLNYLLRSPLYRELFPRIAVGTTITNLNQEILAKVPVILPSFNEQRAIASVLSSFDDKIELLEKQNETLEKIGEALFKHWFVDFEFPDENGKPYKSSGGKMIFNEELQKEIPEEWEVKRVKDIVDLTIGRTPPRMETNWFSTSQGIPWISIKDMGNSGVFLSETNEYLSNEAINKFNIPVIKKGTAVLSFKLTVGRVGITNKDMLSNEAIAHFNSPKYGLNQFFLFLFLKNFDFNSLGSTSSIASAVNSESLKNIGLFVPEKCVLNKFYELVNLNFNKIELNQNEINTLKLMRDLLLPKLMTGKIRVN